MRASGAPVEDKNRAKSSGVQADASLTALRPPPIKDKRGTKSRSAQPAASSPAPPSRQSRVALRADGAQMEEKRRTKSAGTRVAASSAPPSRQNRVALRADGAPKEEKGRTKISSAQVDTSSTAPPPRQSRATMSCNGPLIKEKKMTKSGGAHSVSSSMAMPPRRGRVALLPNGFLDGVGRAELIEFYTHRDEAIYKRIETDSLARRYRLHDTSETGLEPMMTSEPTDDCSRNWRSCEIHEPCSMMQIFSLKLAYPPAGDQVQLYGFMAVRDSLEPLRNYVFNRTRDDPLIVDREDGFIQMSGPKRGIWWHDMALVEFDMRIKRGDKEADDLQLIDGAVWFADTSTQARVATERIDGDYGSVDICYALLQSALEGTVQIAVSELLGGFSLHAAVFYISGLVHQEMQLFDGVVPGPDGCRIHKLDKCVIGSGGRTDDAAHKYMVSCSGCPRYEPENGAVAADGGGQRFELGEYVIAFPNRTKLGLKLIIYQSGSSSEVARFCISPASTHGSDTFAFDLGFANIHVKISWSTLIRPRMVSRCCR
uniref:Uncharacterized protein n=1 Tax=Avena sativa TaxID=4498 RepID=A0ACD5Y7T8_AVESA